jgi:hypothetical protein
MSLGFLWSARANGDEIMPLVRIDLRKGKDLSYRQEIGRVVYEAMKERVVSGMERAAKSPLC